MHEYLCSDREQQKYLHRIPLPLIDRIEIREILCFFYAAADRNEDLILDRRFRNIRLYHQTRIDGATFLEAFPYAKLRYKYWKI
ncbi:MAG: hypothetical protein PUK05_02400 [Peptoniphilaceae bacterium]|nr:hypothetical protein [Peptoniphilaceae bacterium]MDY5765723.1 hypothetical protein [Peptoniphilaceae bacterium]